MNPIQKPAVPPAGPAQQVKRSSNTVRPQTAEERRRAQRVLLKMPVIIHIPGKANPLHGFTHTVSANGALIIVPEALRGQGVATQLVLAGLASARERGLQVIPQCPVFAAYMRSHPDTHDLLADQGRALLGL